MGVDCGFDMVPRLTESSDDQRRWTAFVDEVKEVYREDTVLEVQHQVIVFHVGEWPRLPLEGYKFLRFSSKVSGSQTAAEPYIRQVYCLARKIFDGQVKFWHEINDNYGYYDWQTVHDSHRSYSTPSPNTRATPNLISDGSSPITQTAHNEAADEMFTLMSIARKGQGLVAAQKISKGSRILSEKPIIVVPQGGHSMDNMSRLIARKLQEVSKSNQRAYFALHNNFPDLDPFLGIAKTNVLPLGTDATEGGLFLKASRINHACLPNCQHTWNANINEETIHVVRDVLKGEELTISYSDSSPSEIRREQLLHKFGFECTCTLCSLPRMERLRSDNRLMEIQQLDKVLGEGGELMLHPQQHLQRVYSVVRLLEAEQVLDARLPRAYYDAFQIVIAHGDQARAKVFAERAYAARLCCEGTDSPTTARMKLLSQNSKGHQLYGRSKRWNQKRSQVPKDLTDAEFEEWLWKRSTT